MNITTSCTTINRCFFLLKKEIYSNQSQFLTSIVTLFKFFGQYAHRLLICGSSETLLLLALKEYQNIDKEHVYLSPRGIKL